MKMRFYICEICGKVIAVLSDTEIPTECCGQAMRELVPNLTDAAVEKHIPVYSASGSTVSVRVGSVPHPMTDSHSIVWIGLQTAQGFYFKDLHPGDAPEARFLLSPEDHAEAVYAYCDLHGLWCLNVRN